MRGVILKETEILNNALENGVIEKKPTNTLRILAKHYLKQNENVDETILLLNDFMINNYNSYKPSKWKDIIEQMVKSIKKADNLDLIDIDSVSIYKSEWECIIALNDRVLEKLAFILLVYQKVNELKNSDSKGWINNNLSDIFREGDIGYTGIDQRLLLNKLYKLQYIKQKNTVDSTSLQINYRELNKENDIKLIIDDLDYAITYYYEKRDNLKYISCQKCNKRVAIKNKKDTSRKYCNSCKKDVDLEKYKKYNKNRETTTEQ